MAFRHADTAVLVDYQGITVPQVTELRRQIRAAGGTYRVVKNTLAKRATAGTSFEPFAAQFIGTTAVVYTTTDPVLVAKALTTFVKATPTVSIKAAVVQGRQRRAGCGGQPGEPAGQAGAVRDVALRAPGADAAARHGAVGGAARPGERCVAG